MEHYMEVIMKSAGAIIFLIFIIIAYGINIHCFSKIILPIKLSSKSPEYSSTNGQLKQLIVKIGWTNSSHANKTSFDLKAHYEFKVNGIDHKGLTTLGLSNFHSIKDMIKETRKYFPDQIMILRILSEKSTLFSINDFDEYKIFLRDMPLDYRPKQGTSPVTVYYEAIHPENNCLSQDATISTIMTYVLGVLFGTAIGCFFMPNFIPLEKTYSKVAISVLIMLTAVVPALFMKNKLPQEKLDQDKTNSRYWIYDLVVDQNNSEAYLKEQLRQQKLKYQNEIQQPQ